MFYSLTILLRQLLNLGNLAQFRYKDSLNIF